MKKITFLLCLSMLCMSGFGQGMKAETQKSDAKQVIKTIKENPAVINLQDENGHCPLHIAVQKNNIEVIEYLISQNADLNIKDRFNATPLIYAVNSGNLKLSQLLVENDADVNVLSAFGTPLHRAAMIGHFDLVKTLVENDAKVNTVNSPQNWTALNFTFGKYPDIVKFLIKNGADLGVKDFQGRTFLHWAIDTPEKTDGEAALLVIENGAGVNLPDSNGDTPLLLAVKTGQTEIASALIKKGADLSFREKATGRTPLHLSALYGYNNMAELLIDCGIGTGLKDNNGKTAAFYANKHGNQSIQNFLPTKENVEGANNSQFLSGKMGENETAIWNLKTRGWVIKTQNHLFVINNEEQGRQPDQPGLANGYITASELTDQSIVALYTTYHAAPNTYEFIHGLQDSFKNITYLHYKKDPWKGDLNVKYLEGRSKTNIGNAEIYSYEQTDQQGMGYLGYIIKADGLKIYISGYYPASVDDYCAEIDHIYANYGSCDIAFLHTAGNPDLEKKYIEYACKQLKPQMVLTGNVGQHQYFSDELIQQLFYGQKEFKLINAHDPGTRFIFTK